MDKLPLPIYSLIGKHLDFRDDWLSFLATCKKIRRGLLEYPSRPSIDIFLKRDSNVYNMSWKGEYTEGWTFVRGSCINFTEKSKCKYLYIDYYDNIYPYKLTDEDKKPFFCRSQEAVTVYRSRNPKETADEFKLFIEYKIFENNNSDEEDRETYISFPYKELLKVIEELNYIQEIADENGKTLYWI